MGAPDVNAVITYLDGTSYPADEIERALAAETAAQAKVCRVPDDPDDMEDDLAEALCRRVARNLAMRAQPRMTVPGDQPVIIPSRDPEVRRLEAPFRKLVMG